VKYILRLSKLQAIAFYIIDAVATKAEFSLCPTY